MISERKKLNMIDEMKPQKLNLSLSQPKSFEPWFNLCRFRYQKHNKKYN